MLESFSNITLPGEERFKETPNSERLYVSRLFNFIRWLEEKKLLDDFGRWLSEGKGKIDTWRKFMGDFPLVELMKWFTPGEALILKNIVIPYCPTLRDNFGNPFDIYEKSIKERIKTAQQRGWKGGTNPEIEKWLGE